MQKQSRKRKYLFGPVPSRRLGSSLGIDLIPHKTCSLNCVYCECGRTTALTVCRKEYVPTALVLEELDFFLHGSPRLDYVTFAGSGEPLLHSKIGEIIDWLKKHYPGYPIAVLTNGTLLTRQEVRAQIKRADLVIPSLDAVSEKTFQKINRPHPSLDYREIISGLEQFRREHRGEVRLEVFIIPGLNNTEAELARFREALRRIKPDRLQLNTLDRPGAEDWVCPASTVELQRCAHLLGEGEIVAGYQPRRKIPLLEIDHREAIIAVLQRRPSTTEDLLQLLNLRPIELNKYLRLLVQENLVEAVREKRGLFYKIKNK